MEMLCGLHELNYARVPNHINDILYMLPSKLVKAPLPASLQPLS